MGMPGVSSLPRLALPHLLGLGLAGASSACASVPPELQPVPLSGLAELPPEGRPVRTFEPRTCEATARFGAGAIISKDRYYVFEEEDGVRLYVYLEPDTRASEAPMLEVYANHWRTEEADYFFAVQDVRGVGRPRGRWAMLYILPLDPELEGRERGYWSRKPRNEVGFVQVGDHYEPSEDSHARYGGCFQRAQPELYPPPPDPPPGEE